MGMAFSEGDVAGVVAPLSPAERTAAGDRGLVVAFQQGDRAAFDEIYRRYRCRAELVCRHYLPSREDAEEAAQETMMRVLRGLPALAGEYALRPWVDRIAANVALDAIRARGRRPATGPAPAREAAAAGDRAGGAADPSDVVEAMVRSREVRETLAAMPEPHRAALVLREVEGRSHTEIGDALGISSYQAKALVHRARRRFQKAWGDERHRVRALIPLLVPARLRELIGDLLHPAALPRAASALAPLGPAGAGPAEHLAAAVAALVLVTGVGGSLSVRPDGPVSPRVARAAAEPSSTVPPAPPARNPGRPPAAAPVAGAPGSRATLAHLLGLVASPVVPAPLPAPSLADGTLPRSAPTAEPMAPALADPVVLRAPALGPVEVPSAPAPATPTVPVADPLAEAPAPALTGPGGGPALTEAALTAGGAAPAVEAGPAPEIALAPSAFPEPGTDIDGSGGAGVSGTVSGSAAPSALGGAVALAP